MTLPKKITTFGYTSEIIERKAYSCICDEMLIAAKEEYIKDNEYLENENLCPASFFYASFKDRDQEDDTYYTCYFTDEAYSDNDLICCDNSFVKKLFESCDSKLINDFYDDDENIKYCTID